MARFIMIVVLGAIITYGVTSITLNEFTSQGTENSVDNFSYNRARNIASSMSDIILMRVANDGTYRVNTPVTEDLLGGEATYIVEDTFFENDSLIKISVNGNFNGTIQNVITYAKISRGGREVPSVVRGAWTANGDLNNTISDMFIDGRDHDLSLNIIPGTGRAGVSSSAEFRNEDNAAIGGTKDSIDYPMSFPENPAVIEENYTWGGTFPQSPDEILGFPEGTLKSAAQSGLYGSQYLLNPKKLDKEGKGLNYPVSGVTYIEITDGKERSLKFFEKGNSGIVVVHAPDRSSRLKGVKMDKKSDGVLTGLLITDYSFHHHLNILGGVFQLSSNLETKKNCGGNKDHWVYYSSEAILAAIGIAAEITGLSSGEAGYGFGKKRINVKYVYE